MAASLLAWPGAVLIGVSLGLLGSGGSIITVPVLVYLIGQDEKVAIAGSLFVVGNIAAAGSLQYVRAKLIDWRNVFIFGVPGMAGTYFGALIAAYVSGVMQLALFSLVMLSASYMMLRPVKLTDEPHEPREAWKIAIDGFIVGIITGRRPKISAGQQLQWGQPSVHSTPCCSSFRSPCRSTSQHPDSR